MDPTIAKCGYRCDLCLMHEANLKSENDKRRMSEALAKYYECRLAPEEIHPCKGCAGAKEPPDKECRVHPCAREKGSDNCGGCPQFGCDKLKTRMDAVEVQIADDFAEQWAKSPRTWQCGAIFGHLAPTKSMVKKPGEWNRMTITCQGQMIYVMLNGEQVTAMNMALWTSATKNPDGSEIPPWLNKPFAELPTYGRIGLQGKHAGAPIYFRNVKIKKLD